MHSINILHIFAAEVVCMCPFTLISTLMIFLNMGVQHFQGKANLLLNFTLLFAVIVLPVLSFCVIEIESDKYANSMHKKEKKGVLKF